MSRGVVKGTVRVVTSLKDASNIQLGDILVVHFTDVGWTPYFPLISGLVTEIGGLVSHGKYDLVICMVLSTKWLVTGSGSFVSLKCDLVLLVLIYTKVPATDMVSMVLNGKCDLVRHVVISMCGYRIETLHQCELDIYTVLR